MEEIQLTSVPGEENLIEEVQITSVSREEHCKFCATGVEGEELENHLKTNEHCLNGYCHLLKVQSLDEIIVMLYGCFFCAIKEKLKLRVHLDKNRTCLQKYCTKFGVIDVESLMKRIYTIKKHSFPSRQPEARAIETKKLNNSKKYQNTITSLNNYKSRVELANYKCCVKCKSNCSEPAAKEVQEHDQIFEELQLHKSSNLHHRRLEKFYLCLSCSDASQDGNNLFKSSLTMREVVEDEKIVFFPSKEAVDIDLTKEIIQQSGIGICMPISSEAINVFPEKTIFKSKIHLARAMFETRFFNKLDISLLYENEIYKYRRAQESGEIYFGVIKDSEKKILASAGTMSSENSITGSSQWFKNLISNMKFRHEQTGTFCYFINIDIPLNNLETLATILIQEGLCVTIKKSGRASGELDIEYFVHLDHVSNEDCSEDCVRKITLRNYLELRFGIISIGNKHAGTYVSSVHQKMVSFVHEIVKAPGCDLFSENYFLQLCFDKKGEARIIGIIWPDSLEDLNVVFAKSAGQSVNKELLISHVERNISVSSNARILRHQFQISELEAEALSKLVNNNQIHMCGEESCVQCSHPELPALQTLVTECLTPNNLRVSQKFKVSMLTKLRCLSLAQKKELPTYQWLNLLWDDCTGEVTHDGKYLVVTMDEEEFQFEIDEKIITFMEEYYPLTAVYHYALTCCRESDNFSIILKRLKISECFTRPFNPLYLKAANANVEVRQIRSIKMWEESIANASKEVECSQIDDLDIYVTHKLVSIIEAISLFDCNKQRVECSNTVEYVDAKQQRKVILKKVVDTEKGEQIFKLDNCDDKFVLIPSNISRHFDRYNGKNLLLAETAIWYDFTGKDKSEELYETFLSSEYPIPESDVICVNPIGDNCKLPVYIFCNNGDVLKKRSKPKILISPYPWSSFHFKYSKLLLFYPLRSEEELLHGDINMMFEETAIDALETIAAKNERYF